MHAGERRAAVLLFKGVVEDDEGEERFVAVLAGAPGVRACWSRALLEARCVNADVLKDELQSGRFGALTATSPRAAWALREAAHDSLAAVGLAETPVLVVGAGTEAACRAAGAPLVWSVPGARGARDLAEHVVALGREGRPVLLLVGDKRLDVLPDRLREAGVAFSELRVYETAPRADAIEAAIEQLARLRAVDDADVHWAVFFSPSGVAAVAGVVALSRAHNPRLRLAAIGATTQRALVAAGLPVDAVAATPTPEGLLTALFAD